MGLGGYPTVGLADARKLSERWRSLAASGRDPIKEREAERRAARREDISLSIITEDAFEARKAELKDDGKAGRWLNAAYASRSTQAGQSARNRHRSTRHSRHVSSHLAHQS